MTSQNEFRKQRGLPLLPKKRIDTHLRKKDYKQNNNNPEKHEYSPRCQNGYKINSRKDKKDITLANFGASSELIVAADLIRRGYYVYKALTPNSPFDLLATRDRDGEVHIIAIEVDSNNHSSASDPTSNCSYVAYPNTNCVEGLANYIQYNERPTPKKIYQSIINNTDEDIISVK